MMTKPSITELDKSVDSRYTLVAMAAKRARMIGLERNKEDGDEPVYDPKREKPVSQAVDEIAGGVVGYVRSEAIDRAREYEEEKIIAISKLEREPHPEPPHKTDETESKQESEQEEPADGADLFGDEEEYSALDAALKLALAKESEQDG